MQILRSIIVNTNVLGTSSLALCTTLVSQCMVECLGCLDLQWGCQKKDKELLPHSQPCHQGKSQCTTVITTVKPVGPSRELCWWQLWKWALKQWRPLPRSTLVNTNCFAAAFIQEMQGLHLLQLHHSYLEPWQNSIGLSRRNNNFIFTCTNWLEYVNFHLFSLRNGGCTN